MRQLLRQLLFALIAFAIVGATTTQLARAAASVAPMTMGGAPCDMSMPMAGAEHGSPMVPCKGMTPDCMKQMGCVTNAGLPVRVLRHGSAAPFSAVEYWIIRSDATGFTDRPEPLPPRTS